MDSAFSWAYYLSPRVLTKHLPMLEAPHLATWALERQGVLEVQKQQLVMSGTLRTIDYG